MPAHRLRRVFTLLTALALGTAAGLFSYFGPLSDLDQQVTNWIYDHNRFLSADTRITIVSLDSGDWSRTDLANAVETLSMTEAAVIGLDVDLSEGSDNSTDNQLLAEACEAAGNVVAAATAVYNQPSGSAAAPARSDSELLETSDSELPELPDSPIPGSSRTASEYNTFADSNTLAASSTSSDRSTLADGSTASDGGTLKNRLDENANPMEFSRDNKAKEASDLLFPYNALLSCVTIGVSNATQQSPDGIIRNAALTVTYKQEEYDSFSAAVYKLYQDSIGSDYALPDLNSDELFHFNSVDDESSDQILSLDDLLSGNYDPAMIAGNIVLVGEYESSSQSTLSAFLHPEQNQQEVSMQADIVQALLNQKTVRNVSILFQSAFYAFLIAGFYLGVTSRRSRIVCITNVVFLSLTVVLLYILNQQGYHFLLLTPLLFLVLETILILAQQMILNRRARRQMEGTFKMYVDSSVVDAISEKSAAELTAISARRHIAVLFVDIRGFTTISESLAPEQVVEILNEYLSLVADAVAHWDGTLDKFIGDAAMAVFNAPRDLDDYVFRAVCAAVELSRSADYLYDKYMKRYGKAVRFGVGINCGDAIVGNIGSKSRMDYTAIGDTVNTASRLEGSAKAGQILVSESVWEQVADRVTGSLVGSLHLKGKVNTVTTYEITGIRDDSRALTSIKEV